MADNPPKGGPEKLSMTVKYLVPLTIVILLSLVTWSFFYAKQMPLAPADTSLVVGFWLLVVFAVRWMLGRLTRSKSKPANRKSS
jgi:hypothetical protein